MIETHSIRTRFSRFPTRFDWPSLPFQTVSGDAVHLNKSFAKLYTDRSESLPPEMQHLGWYHACPLTRSEYLFNRIHRLLDRHLPPDPDNSVLEVGCGSGEFCKTLVERGYRAFGIDLSHFSLRQARQNAPACEFERASFYESFQDLFGQPFDAIVFLHAVEYLHSPQRFIRRVVESLAPGGLFVVSARFQGYLTSLPSVLTGHRERADLLQPLGGMAADETRITLGQLLEESGLEIIEFLGAESLPAQWRSQLFVTRKPLRGSDESCAA